MEKDTPKGIEINQEGTLSQLTNLQHNTLSLRHYAATTDLYSGGAGPSLSNLRLEALKHVENMINTDEFNWVQLGPTAIPYGQTDSSSRVLVTGRVTAIVVDSTDPNVIYLGAAQGGVWKTKDGGRNWAPTSDNAESLAIGALVMDPKDHNVLYAGTGEGNMLGVVSEPSYYGCGVLKTTDGGEHWSLKGGGQGGEPFIGSRFFRLAINHFYTNIIFAATSMGVYRSINSGEEWSPVTIDLPRISDKVKAATDIVINPNDAGIAYSAFWGDGIYKTENANDDVPRWKKLPIKLPSAGTKRIALGISLSSPQILYALMSEIDYLNKFYRTDDGGLTWYQIKLPTITNWGMSFANSMGIQSTYNIHVAVDPTSADTVYLSGVPLLRAIRNPMTGIWDFSDIGRRIHTDHHALAFHPTNRLVIYDGSDGGIYRSSDGGTTWDDVVNEGLCIAQFEFIDHHPHSDAIIFGGTQDNGTEIFRNNSVFYHSDDSDGGYVSIDPNEPNVVIHERFDPDLYRSEEGGKFGSIENGGSWEYIRNRNVISEKSPHTSLYYPPFVIDQQNPKNIALGTSKLYLDDNQGKNGWEIVTPTIPDLIKPDLISAISYVNSNLIYIGTTGGKVVRLTNYNYNNNNDNSTWTAKPIHNGSLPMMYIWDITTHPDHDNIVFIVMGGYLKVSRPRIWRGEVLGDVTVKWTDISGKGSDMLPNTPINAIAIEPERPETIYIGTDIGVFRTTNSGDSWKKFGRRLPRSPIFDIRLHNHSRLLRAATHGRGIWELKLDEKRTAEIDLYVRDHLMDTGRSTSSSNQSLSGITIPFEDILQHVKMGQKLVWYMCADIKIDSASYQMNIDDVDYVKFECVLEDREVEAGSINRVYVQIHNRGTKSVERNNPASIRVFYAKTIQQSDHNSVEFPDLPHNFWDEFSNNSFNNVSWNPIGETKQLPSGIKTLTNTEPTIIEWDWNVPSDIDASIGLLVIVESPEDPISEENKKIFDIETLVRSEKHVGIKLKNMVST